MKTSRRKQRGQVIVMVTVALLMMLGILGLAVDLGWAYFIKKSAQAAADAAALAAVGQAYATAGQGSYATMDRPSPAVRCSSIAETSNLKSGCFYAERNGFIDTESGLQQVYMEAGVNSAAPRIGTATYWVTATAAQGISQLFSAVFGNTFLTSSARATAAIVEMQTTGSLYTMNRQFDRGASYLGNDIDTGGNGKISAGGDIYLASNLPGGKDNWAGEATGSSRVISEAGGIYVRGTGAVENPTTNWSPRPETGFNDGDRFKDPLRGKGQPPPPTGLADCPVPGGNIDAYCAGGVCGPGNYYAVDSSGVATGIKLKVNRSVTKFGSAGACATGAMNSGGFGNYVFFGGLSFPDTHTVTTFDPGRYVVAGVKAGQGALIDFSNQNTLQDNTPLGMKDGAPVSQPNTDPGEIFILTDTRYPGLEVPSALSSIASQLQFGIADLQAGNNSSTVINLHGLNPDHPALPADLKPFAPVVIWQDQANSTVKYTQNGYIDCGQSPETSPTCAAGYSLDRPYTTSITGNSPLMNLQATPNAHFYGTIYQPRGAWMNLQGGGKVNSPMQVITGSIRLQGGPEVVLQPLESKLLRKVVALIE